MSRRGWISSLLVLVLAIAALAWWRGGRSAPRGAGAPVDDVDQPLPRGGDPRAAPTAALAGQVRDRAGAPVVGTPARIKRISAASQGDSNAAAAQED